MKSSVAQDDKEYQDLYKEIEKERNKHLAYARQKAMLLLEKAEKNAKDSWVLKASIALVKIANTQRNVKEFNFYLDKSQKYIKQNTNGVEKVDFWLQKGYYYKDVSRNIDSSLFFYDKARKKAEELGYFSGKYVATTYLGYLALDRGRVSQALDKFLSILPETEKSNDLEKKQTLYNNIGHIYSTIGLYQEATAMFVKSNQTAKEVQNITGIFTSKINEADCFMQIGNFEKSLNILKELKHLAQDIGEVYYQLIYYTVLAQAYNGNEKYEKAIETIEESNKIVYPEDIPMRYDLNTQKAKALMGLKDTLAAYKTMLQFEKEISQEEGFLKYANLEGLHAMMLVYQYLKNYPKSLYYAKRYQAYYAKSYNEKLSKDIYMKETKERIKIQEEKSALKEAVLNEQLILFGLVAFILITFLIFAIFAIWQKTRYSNKLSTKNNIIQEQNMLLINQKEEIQIQNEQLTTQSEQLIEANETKDKLFAILGHDLRSPIGSLESVLNLMNMGLVSYEEFQDFMPQFHKNVKNMQTTLENLLQWSVTQMQGLQAHPTEVMLAQVVDEKMQLFGEIAKTKNITLCMEVPKEITVWADENHVRLLFRNLINNAIKFTSEAGKITVSTQESDSKIIVHITDSGVGMTKEQVGKLFKKNQNFTTYGTSGEKGTGLGLQLCQEIVVKNGGEIWAVSEQGKGSTFSFSLPIA